MTTPRSSPGRRRMQSGRRSARSTGWTRRWLASRSPWSTRATTTPRTSRATTAGRPRARARA
eukprot:3396653-Alexandrium_andersonii.AAC.1